MHTLHAIRNAVDVQVEVSRRGLQAAVALEKQDDLLRRIDEASKYVPVENLSLSPQCGFASVEQGNLLSWDEQRRKLELVVDTARKVWG